MNVQKQKSSFGELPSEQKKRMLRRKKKWFDEDQEERTIFVGNVDTNCKKRKLVSFFSNYGNIEAVRLRSAAPGEQNISKKIAVIKHNFHQSRSTLNAYVRFETNDMMEAALAANGMVLEGNHLRVDRAIQENHERHCAVFVGNLPFECEEEKLFGHFKDCGEIDHVRIVRDKDLSSGKGFGYVNFKSPAAVEVALQLNGRMFSNRSLRVQRCVKKPKTLKTNKNEIREGQQIGFMKTKGETTKMRLQFMKNNKGKGRNDGPKKGKESKSNAIKKDGKYSGMEVIESQRFKEIKKSRKKPTKDERKKVFIARYLTGSKPAKSKAL